MVWKLDPRHREVVVVNMFPVFAFAWDFKCFVVIALDNSIPDKCPPSFDIGYRCSIGGGRWEAHRKHEFAYVLLCDFVHLSLEAWSWDTIFDVQSIKMSPVRIGFDVI